MTYPTYPRPAYRVASGGYAYGPSVREVTARVRTRAVPVHLWGDLPGTPAYPVIETSGVDVTEAGQMQMASTPIPVPVSPAFRQNVSTWFVSGDESVPLPGDLPPTTPSPGILSQTAVQLPPAQTQPDLPPPPTTIPDTPPAKSTLNTGWIIAGVGLGVLALGGILYLATKKTPHRRRNPRRRMNPRRRSNASPRREEVLLLEAPRESSYTRRRRNAPKRRRVAKKRRRNAAPQRRRRRNPIGAPPRAQWTRHHQATRAPQARQPQRANPKHKKNSARCHKGMRIQTLVFPKSDFSRHQAVAWARKRGYRAAKVDETKHSFRLRQRKPASFGKHSFRTVPLGTSGVTGVVACPR